MTVDVSREEFEARVGVLEREVEGEKVVTRYILEQTRRNGDDLAVVKARLDRLEQKVDGLDRKVDDFVKNLPRIVAEAVRDANRNRRER
jgi:uncharacterized protein YoxC